MAHTLTWLLHVPTGIMAWSSLACPPDLAIHAKKCCSFAQSGPPLKSWLSWSTMGAVAQLGAPQVPPMTCFQPHVSHIPAHAAVQPSMVQLYMCQQGMQLAQPGPLPALLPMSVSDFNGHEWLSLSPSPAFTQAAGVAAPQEQAHKSQQHLPLTLVLSHSDECCGPA